MASGAPASDGGSEARRSRRRACFTLALLGSLGVAAAGCAFGPESAGGCRSDADCEAGAVCRRATCYRFTTPVEAPGEAGDASAGEADGPAEALSD